MNAPEPVLALEDVAMSYPGADGPVEVLRGVDLSLAEGETLALTGESGSGKSTLLHIAGGLELAARGSVRVVGQDVTAMTETERAAMRCRQTAVIFQQFNLIPSLKVADNIAFQARLAGREDPEQIAALAKELGLEAQLQKYPEALSGGQQQRVAIARAVAARPRLLLADEPTGNLDEATAAEVLEQLLALVASTKASLLLVTHSPAIAARMDRRLHLSGGRLA